MYSMMFDKLNRSLDPTQFNESGGSIFFDISDQVEYEKLD